MSMNSEEIWKPVVENPEKYEVSDLGRVKSLFWNKTKFPRIMKPCISKGRKRLMLGGGNGRDVHRLVAIAFVPNPDNKPEVNHIDGNSLNNRADNLEWVTRSENELHAYRIGIKKNANGERCNSSTITDLVFLAINMALDFGKLNQTEIARFFGCKPCTVCQIKNHYYGRKLPSSA